MRDISKTVLFAALAAAGGACAAQEVGRVVASSPIQRPVEVPQQVCTTEEVQVQPSQWQPQRNCVSRTRIETRTVGYDVTYEYAGRRYSTQTSQPPGATIPLQVSAMGVSSLAPPLAAADGGPDASGRGTAYGTAPASAAGVTYSTLPQPQADGPVPVQPGVVVPTTTYSTTYRVAQPAPVIVQPAPVIVQPAYPAYPPYGGYYPAPAWGGMPIGLSLGLGYSRWR